MFSFAKKREGHSNQVLSDSFKRQRKAQLFTSFTEFFSSRITVHFSLFNRKWGSRECPARVISDKIWPPFAAVKVSIFEFFSCLCFYPEYFLSLFILRKPQNLKKMPILFDNIQQHSKTIGRFFSIFGTFLECLNFMMLIMIKYFFFYSL